MLTAPALPYSNIIDCRAAAEALEAAPAADSWDAPGAAPAAAPAAALVIDLLSHVVILTLPPHRLGYRVQ